MSVPSDRPRLWVLTFVGRAIGGLGVAGRVRVEVVASTIDKARMKAYDTHENITGGSPGVVATEKTPGDS